MYFLFDTVIILFFNKKNRLILIKGKNIFKQIKYLKHDSFILQLKILGVRCTH